MTTKEKSPEHTAEPIKYGRYEVLKLIGEGAMGRVYLASDPVLKRQVAIKIVSMESQLDEVVRREFLKRFSIEARLSAQLSHPSIVPVYDAGEEDGVPWIAFQYISGVTLDKLIKTHGRLSVKWAVNIATNIASALQQAHKINVVHRDIKPSNIIIDRHGGIAKLTDFGVAKSPLASLTMEGNAMGSPGYMSPEQIEGRDLDHRSDLFSLGVVLYEMLTGKHPFIRDTITTTAYATISGKYTPVKLIAKDVPARLDAIISQCLVPDLDKRIPDAAQLLALLSSVASKTRSGEQGRRRISSLTSGALELGEKCWSALCAGCIAVAGRIKSVSSTRAPLENSGLEAGKREGTANSSDATSVTPVLPRADLAEKKHSGFSDFIQHHSALVKIAGVGILTIAGIFAAILFSRMTGETGKTTIWFPESSLDKSETALVTEFKTFFSDGDLDSAASRAVLLTLGENTAATGQFLQGLIACREKEFDDAMLAFETAEGLPNGKKVLRRNRHYMVVRYALVNERLPDMLVAILARNFRAEDDRSVRVAVKEKPYWPRWNALRIRQTAGKKVDFTVAYILDLKYAEERRIRLQAIKELGDLGDSRAIPELKKAKRLKKKDPYVSAAAARVLRRVFKIK